MLLAMGTRPDVPNTAAVPISERAPAKRSWNAVQRPSLEVPSWEGLLGIAQTIKVEVGISAVALHRDDLHVPSKVPGVQAADGQTISVPGQSSGGVLPFPGLVQQLQWGRRCCIEVGPDF